MKPIPELRTHFRAKRGKKLILTQQGDQRQCSRTTANNMDFRNESEPSTERAVTDKIAYRVNLDMIRFRLCNLTSFLVCFGSSLKIQKI